MNIDFISSTSKEDVFRLLSEYLENENLRTVTTDTSRPWGGFFVLDESRSVDFIAKYFPHLTRNDLSISGKLSPKILVVAPEKRLSWQYHHRRAEIWKLIGGVAGVVTSDDDTERITKHLEVGEIVRLKQGERHRLIGLNGWGVVAEIWQHTNADHPSDEEDIVRVQDDFGR